MFRNVFKSGFTLAEVLIVIGIIGVVAAVTIPILIREYQNTQYVTQLKKAYNQFNQALKQMAADANCGNDLVCTGDFKVPKNTRDFGADLIKYFKVSKYCEYPPSSDLQCKSWNYNENFDGSGTNHSNYVNGRYNFLTADGIIFSIYSRADMGSDSENCKESTGSGVLGYTTQLCGDLIIDTNGSKGPNYMGRDVWLFYITNGKGAMIYPSGGADDNSPWSTFCTSTNPYGMYCAGRVIEKGWVMDY